jgi:glycosyltransferase involved in cell wall biosynthesis
MQTENQAPYKIILAHNYYLQSGGEDRIYQAELSLLRRKGHIVIEYVDDNRRIATMKKADVAVQTLWSRDSYRKISNLISVEKPDLVHLHNTFPLISPSVYYACQRAGVPVIQSLDNPRLICAAATFYRNGQLCQDCLGKTPPWPSVLHACYHHSRLQTSVVASMLTVHRWARTWDRKVSLYLVATDFFRKIFIEAGLPAAKIVQKPHFILDDPGYEIRPHPGNYAVFIARLDPEKGTGTMLQAWKDIRDIPLKIRGDGQLLQEAQNFIANLGMNNAEIIGRLDDQGMDQLRKNARFLVWPSDGFYETFGMAAVECFASGIPVIASRIGVMNEIVTDGLTGLHFTPGDPADLAAKVRWAWEHPKEMTQMGKNARGEYESKYTAENNYGMLMEIYQRLIETRRNKAD